MTHAHYQALDTSWFDLVEDSPNWITVAAPNSFDYLDVDVIEQSCGVDGVEREVEHH